jgi:LVIVD repeat
MKAPFGPPWRLGNTAVRMCSMGAILTLSFASETLAQSSVKFELLGSYQTGCCCPQQVDVVDMLAYVPCYSAGFQLVDVSNSADPRVIRSVITTNWPVGVVVSGHRAYVIEENEVSDGRWRLGRLEIINAEVPGTALVEGGVDLAGRPGCLQLVGNNVFIGCGRWESGGPENVSGRLYCVDVSNPRSPTVVGQLDLPGGPVTLLGRGPLPLLRKLV